MDFGCGGGGNYLALRARLALSLLTRAYPAHRFAVSGLFRFDRTKASFLPFKTKKPHSLRS